MEEMANWDGLTLEDRHPLLRQLPQAPQVLAPPLLVVEHPPHHRYLLQLQLQVQMDCQVFDQSFLQDASRGGEIQT